jgi:dTDP-4-dehydrorhamnose 3,5-epimerase/reductase
MAAAESALRVTRTAIPGLLLVDLPVHGDARGWFKENWQREKMVRAGLPDFVPVQNNISFNDAAGTTRGIHAEPWDKFVSVAAGRVFAAWVDLRKGPSFGTVVTAEIDTARAVFVPRGVGNSYQTLTADTAYTYLVTDHWSPEAEYTFLNLADETVDVAWPIPLSSAEISEKDRAHPRLADVVPMRPRRILVLGAGGQLGRALREEFGDDDSIEYATRAEVDVTDSALATARHWRDYAVIINAAAYTAVDDAETPEGRAAAWDANAKGVSNLAAIAIANDLTLVHVSTDYVFDGTKDGAYTETDPLSPLSVYGQTKAAGDTVVAATQRHYVVRTSWVVGDGRNFVSTMSDLAARGVRPRVVADQRGRLTFADDIARGIRHLLEAQAPYGVYNLTSSGDVVSWADVARQVYAMRGQDPASVHDTTTAEYYAGSDRLVAPRPANSRLDLSKIEATGFTPRDGHEALRAYLTT